MCFLPAGTTGERSVPFCRCESMCVYVPAGSTLATAFAVRLHDEFAAFARATIESQAADLPIGGPCLAEVGPGHIVASVGLGSFRVFA